MILDAGTYFTYSTPHGPITIHASKKGITRVILGSATLPGTKRPSKLTTCAANELLEYFAGKRTVFNVALDTQGSAFQHAVWDELMLIPYAGTCTAAGIAARIGKPTSYRAVGSAIKKNPLAVIIPDHRIIGADGHPLGDKASAQIKGALLTMEQKNAKGPSPVGGSGKGP